MNPCWLSGLFLVLLATGCREAMFSDSKFKPYEATAFFEDGTTARPIPPHTVARGHFKGNNPFFTGKAGTNLVEGFPFPMTRPLLERGQERFNIYCSVCHGRTGEGNGMIVQRGFPQPPSFHIERLRQAPEGHYFDVITRGYGVMFSYAARVSVEDRWAITAYIRALQLSRQTPYKALPDHAKAALQQENP